MTGPAHTAANPPWLAAALSGGTYECGAIATAAAPDWYRIGDGVLGIGGPGSALHAVAERLYGACRVLPGPEKDLAVVQTCVEPHADVPAVFAHFHDPAPLDDIAFLQAVSPERGFMEAPCEAAGWRLVEQAGVSLAAFAPGRVVAPPGSQWVMLLLSLSIARLMRLQAGVLFLHAATLGVGGRGFLLVGPKGAGKTTIALGMAARGYGFWGDEIAALRLRTRELLALPRGASVRPGPAESSVGEALAAAGPAEERFPDGGPRYRVRADRMFPGPAPHPLPLAGVLFLGRRESAPRLSLPASARQALANLTPLGASLWSRPPGAIAMTLASVLSLTTCRVLHPGPPDPTCDLLATLGDSACL